MKKVVKIKDRLVGDGQPTFVIAEIGINHNGSLETAKNLIDVAVKCGCDAVKFQKRTIDVVYSKEELDRPRESPWGTTTKEQKEGLELGQEEYEAIDTYCKNKGIMWLASCWDEGSVDFIDQFNPPCYKIASASLTDDELLKHTRSKGKPIILSTGMSHLGMINHAIDILGRSDLIVMHCTSAYPQKVEEGDHGLGIINLQGIRTLERKLQLPIGFSSHDTGIIPAYAAVVMGACAIEKHITLYRAMYGSDQAVSIEPNDLEKLCRMVREFAFIKGNGVISIYPEEIPIMEKLRRKHDQWKMDKIKKKVLGD